MTSPDPLRTLSILLELERLARRAENETALGYMIVNETRRLLVYRQAALFRTSGAGIPVALHTVANIPAPEADAPMTRWLLATVERLARHQNRCITPHTPETLAGDDPEQAREFAPGHTLLAPLTAPDGQVMGLLWLNRADPWQEAERVLLEQLAETLGHAWQNLTRVPPRVRAWPRGSRLLLVGAALALLALLPVPQTALAPAEVVARQPWVVAAPLAGVVAEVLVQPNQPVTRGRPLVRFDDVDLKSRFEVAEKTLAVAEAKARAASQGSFHDPASSAKLALLQKEAELEAANRDFARALLDKVIVRAEQDGIAVFRDPQDWTGRPVQIGQRIMQLADPGQVEMAVRLPVADILELRPGARVQLFLDSDPLHPLDATLEQASHEADEDETGLLAYRLIARFSAGVAPPRIGLRGTAKVYGEQVTLIFYVLRRPLSALRQGIGW